MEEIEITLDDETAGWALEIAAAKEQTVSDFIAELIRKRREYLNAMERFLSTPPVALREPGEPLPSREELHDRSRQRRDDEN